MPNAVFRKSDILNVEDREIREAMLRQFNEGTRLTEEYHLRMFPIWTTKTHHGNLAVHLSHTFALTTASQLRNSILLENLVAKQFQWVFGGNPFCQSLMYGEGYDYPPLYAYNPGDIVGSLPVGIDCVKDDEPFWSASNHSCFKEIWVVPVSRFLWNAAYLGMPAFVRGKLKSAKNDTISFYHQQTKMNHSTVVDDKKNFQIKLPAGKHDIKFGTAQQTVSVVSGGNYSITLNPEHYIDFTTLVKKRNLKKKHVQVEVSAHGEGIHSLSIRVFNGKVNEDEKKIDLRGRKIERIKWDISIKNSLKPWVAVIVPDNDLSMKQELIGTMEDENKF